jgi:hypothetical protein
MTMPFSNKIKYIPKETTAAIDDNIESKNNSLAANIKSEDKDKQRNKLYLKLKQLQFKKQTNQSHKTQQLLQDKLVANVTKKLNKYKEECFELDFNEYVIKYKNNQYDVITKNVTNVDYEKNNIKWIWHILLNLLVLKISGKLIITSTRTCHLRHAL